MLPFVRKRINRILESTAITPGEMDDEADDVLDSDDDSGRSM